MAAGLGVFANADRAVRKLPDSGTQADGVDSVLPVMSFLQAVQHHKPDFFFFLHCTEPEV